MKMSVSTLSLVYLALLSLLAIGTYAVWERINYPWLHASFVIVTLIIPIPVIMCWNWIDRFVDHECQSVLKRLDHRTKEACWHIKEAERGQSIALYSFLTINILFAFAITFEACAIL